MKNKILIIEDDAAILEAMEMMLSEEGYVVEAIEEGQQAIKRILSFRPKMVFLDMLMSGTDGREICEKIKGDDDIKDTKVVMISAYPDAEKLVYRYGADAFLAKPFAVQDLLDAAEKFAA